MEHLKAVLKPKVLLSILIGSFINVISIKLFLEPWNIFPVGIMGLAYEVGIVFKSLFGVSLQLNTIYLLFNLPLIYLAWIRIGKNFTLKTLMTVGLITIFLGLIPGDIVVIQDKLLSIIVSAIGQGISVGILLKAGISTGGTDIISLYYSLYKERSFGTIALLFNCVIIAFASLLTGDLTTAVYMLIVVYVFGVVVDKVNNSTQKYTLFIVTKKVEEVKAAIYSSNLTRGITVIPSEGGFTGAKQYTLMVTLEQSEMMLVDDLIKKADKDVFITTFQATRVDGAFENAYKKIL